MYIAELIALNYRSLKDVRIAFHPGVNVLIGRNDAGKSNILRAVAELFDHDAEGIYSRRQFDPRSDLYRSGDRTADKALVMVRLEGEERSLRDFGGYQKWSYKLEGIDMPNSQFGLVGIDCCFSGNEPKHSVDEMDLLMNAKAIWVQMRISGESRKICIDIEMLNGKFWHFHELPPILPFSLLTFFIWTCHIPAIRDDKLLTTAITASCTNHFVLANGHDDEDRDKRQSAASASFSQIAGYLSDNFAGRKVELNLEGFDFEKPNVIFEPEHVRVTIGDQINTPHYEKGGGTRSALAIDALMLLRTRATAFLLEEPENFLHPHRQRLLIPYLLRFANNNLARADRSPCCTGQVLLATHSSIFLKTASQVDSIVKVEQSPAGETRIRQIKEASQDFKPLHKFWHQLIHTKSADMLFARHVVLVEGCEEYFLAGLGSLFLGANWFDENDVSVVRVSGKLSFPNHVRLLTQYGITSTVVADRDFAADGLEDMSEFLNATLVAKIQTLKQGVRKHFPTGRPSADKLSNLYATDPTCLTLFNEVANDARTCGIFLVPTGAIESLYTTPPSGVSHKEQAALEIAEQLDLTDQWADASKFFNSLNFFEDLLNHVKRQLA